MYYILFLVFRVTKNYKIMKYQSWDEFSYCFLCISSTLKFYSFTIYLYIYIYIYIYRVLKKKNRAKFHQSCNAVYHRCIRLIYWFIRFALKVLMTSFLPYELFYLILNKISGTLRASKITIFLHFSVKLLYCCVLILGMTSFFNETCRTKKSKKANFECL